jgi:hypothetical protein
VFKWPFLPVLNPFYFFSNACQSQSGAIVDVVFKRFRLVIAKVCLERIIFTLPANSWVEVIHRGTDWNFATCKLLDLLALIMVDFKINCWKYVIFIFVNPQ